MNGLSELTWLVPVLVLLGAGALAMLVSFVLIRLWIEA